MNDSPKFVLLLAGPTASGKSALAMQVAERYNGEIVNADSLQVYADLRILSSRPTKADMEKLPHHLYGHIPATKIYNVGIWQTEASKVIKDILTRGKLPIVTGGTGLYFKSLTDGLAPIPDIDLQMRDHIRARLQEEGHDALYQELMMHDAPLAARLRPHDTHRIIRGLEVYHASGKPLSYWQAQPTYPPLACDFIKILLMPTRAWLYERCDARFFAMLHAGALDEVKALRHIVGDGGVKQAIGVKQLSAYLVGDMTLDDAISKAQQQTRNYAKRQMTWFRNQMVTWKSIKEKEYYLKTDYILNFITEKGLTTPLSQHKTP